MNVRRKRFNAYQIDLHYLRKHKGNEFDAVKWDYKIIEQILKNIYGLKLHFRAKRYNDSWLMYLDYLDCDEHVIFGRFASAEYGTVSELVHADNLTLRPNPKLLREGETEYTYFMIRNSDGLLLLQGNQRLSKNRFNEYIQEFGQKIIEASGITFIEVCTLLEQSFFDSIRQLNSVNNILIEISTLEPRADENEAVRALQGEAYEIKATHVTLDFKAKYKREGLKNVFPLLNNYKDKPGVTKIVVKGKLAGAEKVINLNDSQEKYDKRVKVDSNNQPIMSSVEEVLRGIVNHRAPLRGGENENN